MAKVHCDDSGMKALNRKLKAMSTTKVEAGVISSEQHPNFDGTTAQLAAMWHYGFKRYTGDRGLVSFESDFFDPLLWYNVIADKELKKRIKVDLDRHIAGTLSKDDLFARIGEHLSGELREFILSGSANIITSDQGKSKSQKGITMIDTTELVEAVKYEVV